MALDNQNRQTNVDNDDNLPISLRRKRRNTNISSTTLPTSIRTHGISTPPQTPKRTKKRVRFSDPGSSIQCSTPSSSSSGLTPFFRRTGLSTPTSSTKGRRYSTPSTSRHSTPSTGRFNLADYGDKPFSGTLQFEPLRQVLDGRVRRRLRRHRLSEELNVIEGDRREEARVRRTQLEILKEQLAEKDAEMQSMRDEADLASQLRGESGVVLDTDIILSGKVQELEKEIRELKAELGRREDDETVDWTLAAKDPFAFAVEDEDMGMGADWDDDFDVEDSEIITTPTRLNTSFPSPPSTTPNTPSRSVASMHAGTQASLPMPDPEKDLLQERLESLQSELSKLNSALVIKDDHQARLIEKLGEFLPADDSHDHSTLDAALDKVLTTLALSQSQCIETTHAFSALTACITSLGFSAPSSDAALELIGQQFRQARLELEYLMPGEVAEGFENAKLLEMLIERLRKLVDKAKEMDDAVDQYHEQEVGLRQQLNARVSVLDGLKKELVFANKVVDGLREDVGEKDVSIERLQMALNGYRDEVQGLEKLIERIEKDGRETQEQLKSEMQEAQERLQDEVLKHDITRADNEGKDVLLVELERRLSTALHSITELESQWNTVCTANTEKEATITQLQSTITTREKAHGSALAMRDARVSELRREIGRVNEALKAAHVTILDLRNGKSALEEQLDGEKSRGMLAVEAMRDQLARALETGIGYVRGEGSIAPSERSVSIVPETDDEQQESVKAAVVRKGRFLDPRLARRRSGTGKKRRRYDSGLGFLEEVNDGEDGEVGFSKEVEDAVDQAVRF